MQICILILLFSLFAPFTEARDLAPDERPHNHAHGTVNVFIGNRNGLVVVTDSRLSYGNNYQDAGQKLFKLDDNTICTIAGWYSDSGPVIRPDEENAPSFPAEMSIPMVMNLFLMAAHRNQTLEMKLNTVSAVFESTLRALAAVDIAAGVLPNTSPSQITVAGLDSSGKMEILRRDLIPTALKGGIIEYQTVEYPPIV